MRTTDLPGQPSTDLNVSDLELLHHFTTVAYKTIPSRAARDIHELWQVPILQLGFKHEFLLRGILALSALHLGYLRPDCRERYVLKASNHQSVALQAFQEALARVDTSNCQAIFAFSCIIVILAFATPRSPEGGFKKEILDWFHLVRGCSSVLQAQWDTIANSFLAPLLRESMSNDTAPAYSVPNSGRITDLARICSNPGLADEREASSAYALAIHELLKTFTNVSILADRGLNYIPTAFVWPIAIPPLYLDLLGSKKPEAMVILAYYSVLLHKMDREWYMKGWACHLVTTIEASIGKEWQEWLAWPKEVIGLGTISMDHSPV